jgi:hypothetical protein
MKIYHYFQQIFNFFYTFLTTDIFKLFFTKVINWMIKHYVLINYIFILSEKSSSYIYSVKFLLHSWNDNWNDIIFYSLSYLILTPYITFGRYTLTAINVIQET